MAIQIFVTGGTFDKEYNEISGELRFKNTHLEEILELGRSKVNVDINTLMLKDSLEMIDDDRRLILNECNKSDSDQIIITHGTDTMVETAKFIAKEKLNKTLVLTGAMIPINFGSSDGLFNLGSALGFVQSLQYGVYIAMNGRCFEHDKVRKNLQTGIFEPI